MSELTQESLVEKRSSGVISLEWLKDFAEVSGDFNPIHQDVQVAQSMGLPTAIAHGMLIASILHSRAEQVIRENPIFRDFRVQRSVTRFRAMTLLGDEVFTLGDWQIQEGDKIRLDLKSMNQRDETTVSIQFELHKVSVSRA